MGVRYGLYLASGDLPDVFNLMNGPIAEEMISDNKLVNMTEALQAEGKYDEMNQAVRDFFTAKDGNVYVLPSGRVAEFFAYRKPLFEKYGSVGTHSPGRNFFRCAKH